MNKENLVRGTLYALCVLFILTFISLLAKQLGFISNIIDGIEAQSFDLRTKIATSFSGKNSFDNSKVAVITIDDDSVENLANKYSTWTWRRNAYADIIKYLENDGAEKIFLDFLFLSRQQGSENQDNALINEVKKNNNVYLSLSFDYREGEKDADLPLFMASNLDNKSNIDYKHFQFTHVRSIMPELMQATDKLAFINFQRDNDGISRRVPSFFVYRERYYPNIALKIMQDYLLEHKIITSKKFIISQNHKLIMGEKSYPLDDNGFLILNWHEKSNINEVPFWKVINNEIPKGFFKDKIVCIGIGTSIGDAKSVPITQYYPGVKIISTYLNNLLNENFVKLADIKLNILLSFIFVMVTLLLLLRSDTTWVNITTLSCAIVLYFVLSLCMLIHLNIWIDLIYPVFTLIVTYIVVYVIKYIKKSRDFERTYKLATTDGLTELYNHRYFQEQMQANIENAKRYNSHFSLIMVDIDFFKKFNDKFGHQVGDDVLKQIAGILKKSVRSSDIVCRYGGEEMAIILTNTNLEEAVITANKICNNVAQKPFKLLGDIECRVTISLGVSTYPQHGLTPQELIETADKGLYVAKENGRNQVGKGYEDTPSKEE